MDNILAIADSTYTRILRVKSVYILLLLSIVFISTAHRYNDLTGGRHEILMIDLGLVVVSVVGLFSILVLAFDIPRELREKIAQNLLSKPLGRDQYLLGKFLGALYLALTTMTVVACGFCLVLFFEKGTVEFEIVQPLIGIFASIIILAAAATLFGTFLTEVPAAVLTFLVFWLGHSTHLFIKLGIASDGILKATGLLIFGMMPNLYLLDNKAAFSQSSEIPWSLVMWGLVYALVYASVLLSASVIIFRKRDI